VVTALLLCSLSSALPVQAQRADSIIERSSAAYRQLRSLTAEFDQVISNEMIGTYKSRGALAQAGAARLSMRFTDPAGEAIVIDGTSIWIYTPTTAPGQVVRAPVARASAAFWEGAAERSGASRARAAPDSRAASSTASQVRAW